MEYANETIYRPGSIGMVGSYPEPTEVDQRGDLQHITDRINECIDRASSNAERVSILADRIKGTTPENKLDSAKLGSAGSGAIADIHARIDILVNAIGATGSGLSRLERL
jgi:hypothetical protein